MAKIFKTLSLLIAISLAITATNTAQAQGPMMAPSPASEEGPISPGSAGAPQPGLDCTNALLNVSSCLTYVEEGSNLTVPEKGCCPGLSDLVNNQPICLCQLLASGDTFGVKIDTTKALMLPTACKVQTPPVSLCSEIGIPVASPMGPSGAPTSGGPEEPESNPSTISGAPAATPAANTGNPTTRPTTTLAALISLIITIPII